MHSADLSEVHCEGLHAFIRTDVPPQVSHELALVQAMKEREADHARYRTVSANISTPELVAVQQISRTTLNNHFYTL